MTVKEFSEKYDLPYNIAYKASYVIHGYGQMRDRNYDEQELKEETIRFAKSRLKVLKMQYEQYRTALLNLTGKS